MVVGGEGSAEATAGNEGVSDNSTAAGSLSLTDSGCTVVRQGIQRNVAKTRRIIFIYLSTIYI